MVSAVRFRGVVCPLKLTVPKNRDSRNSRTSKCDGKTSGKKDPKPSGKTPKNANTPQKCDISFANSDIHLRSFGQTFIRASEDASEVSWGPSIAVWWQPTGGPYSGWSGPVQCGDGKSIEAYNGSTDFWLKGYGFRGNRPFKVW